MEKLQKYFSELDTETDIVDDRDHIPEIKLMWEKIWEMANKLTECNKELIVILNNIKKEIDTR